MKTLDLFQLRNDFAEVNVLTCFSGSFSHMIIQEVGAAVRRYLESEDVARDAVLDVFAVYIELAQNVKSYLAKAGFQADCPYRAQNAIVAILEVDKGYVVAAGNIATTQDAAAIETRVRELGKLAPAELKQLKRARLRQPVDPSSQGAGLGLIDVAQRAKAMSCTRTPIEDGIEFLSIYVQL